MTRRLLEHLNHELRSPMTVIVGMTDLLLLAPLDEEQGQFLRSVKHAADGLLRMLDEAIDFSRLDAGVLQIREGPFALADVVKEAQEELRQAAAPLQLSAAIEDSTPPRLIGDAPRMRQILVALTRSAAKFRSPHEYQLRIAAEPNGGGVTTLHLALGDQHRPFEALPGEAGPGRFMSLQDFAEHGYAGSGLGLPVSAGYAALMGGRFWMADDASSPVLFRVSLRCSLPDPQGPVDLLAAIEARPDEASSSSSGPRFGPLHVLLVEDTAANRQFFTSVLEQRGHTVVAVVNGQEALRAFESSANERPFDLVLIDLEMPVMDGWRAATALRKLEGFTARPAPLVALTAHSTSDGELSASKLFDAAITKPCELARLYEVIECVAAGKPVAACAKPLAGGPPMGREAERKATSEDRVDYQGAMRRLDGNKQLFDDLVQFVLQDAPAALAELGASLDRNDAQGVERAAHSLKGLVANFGAREATRLATELQRLGHSAELADAQPIRRQLEIEVNLLRRELEGYQARAARQS